MRCKKRKRPSRGKNGFDIMVLVIRRYIILFVSQPNSATYLEKRIVNGCMMRHDSEDWKFKRYCI